MIMGKIKDSKKGKEVIQPSTPQGLSHISFSFKHFTTNKTYNFDYFGKDIRKSHAAYEAFLQKLSELSKINTTQAKIEGKIVGCEPIPYKRLSHNMQEICNGIEVISKDSSLSVFRFCQNNYRLLCKTDITHSNLLYVIAIDFDYSAYDHG